MALGDGVFQLRVMVPKDLCEAYGTDRIGTSFETSDARKHRNRVYTHWDGKTLREAIEKIICSAK